MKNSSDTQEPQAVARQKPKRRRRNGKPEMLSRNVAITSFSATVRLNAIHHKGDDPYIEGQPWLELRGTTQEPVKGVTDVKISMWPRETVEIGTARPASVGSVLGARPELAFGLTWPQAEFDRVWNLAISGHVKFAHVYFTKPHYNSGLVVSASFSSELEE